MRGWGELVDFLLELVDCREFQWLVIRQWLILISERNEPVLRYVALIYRNQHCRMRLCWASRFEDSQQKAVEDFGALNLIELRHWSKRRKFILESKPDSVGLAFCNPASLAFRLACARFRCMFGGGSREAPVERGGCRMR